MFTKNYRYFVRTVAAAGVIVSACTLILIMIFGSLTQTESGEIENLSQVSKLLDVEIDRKTALFPTKGAILWKKYNERPTRLILHGTVDISKYYLWYYGFERPKDDRGMSAVLGQSSSDRFGDLGDRYYEFDGFSKKISYRGVVLLNGKFQMDVILKPQN